MKSETEDIILHLIFDGAIIFLKTEKYTLETDDMAYWQKATLSWMMPLYFAFGSLSIVIRDYSYLCAHSVS